MHKLNRKIVGLIYRIFVKLKEFSIAFTRFFALKNLFIVLINQERYVANVVQLNFFIIYSRERKFREKNNCYVVELVSRTHRNSTSNIYM